MKFKNLALALLCMAGASLAIAPVEKYGPLSIKGKNMVDSTGAAVTLRGMSLFWHFHKGGKEFWVPTAMKNVMLEWHNTVLRAPIGVDDVPITGLTLKGAISDPSTAYTFATRAIDAAILYGFYVIVDWHTEQI
ncbi:MAG: cellulase family glycosylhydrolase, partial [Fibrobacterota bacterium]